jgi:hypothetical protein
MLEQMIFALVVLALGLSFLALAKFKREEIGRARLKIATKIWSGRSPDEVLAKRFKLFVLLMILFIAMSTLIKQVGSTLPNFEIIIPILVVVGSFSLYCGSTKFWRYLTRYFGVVALISVYLIYLVYEGPHSIYIFTWSGFIIAWLLGMKNKLSMFDRFTKLLYRTVLTAAAAIILFDIYTALGWAAVTGTGIGAVFIGQIPFTLYHLASLIFIPPLVGLGKLMVRVKVPVRVTVAARSQVRTQEHW